jgi:hypothetical protein
MLVGSFFFNLNSLVSCFYSIFQTPESLCIIELLKMTGIFIQFPKHYGITIDFQFLIDCYIVFLEVMYCY